MTLAEVLELELLKTTRVVAGHQGVNRKITGVSVVDIPDPLPWVRPNQLLLTTGYAWPRKQRDYYRLLKDLSELPVAGIGLAVPQFFDKVPAVPPELQSSLDLPLLEIPWEVPFVQITEAINNALLAEQRIVLERSEEIHRELIRVASEASSLQDIMESLAKLLEREVALEDAVGHLLAHARRPLSDDWSPSGASQFSKSGPEVKRALQERGYLDIDKLVSPQNIPYLGDLGLGARVVCSVRIRKEVLGLIWIIQDDRPLNDLDLRVAEFASTVAALHLTHQEHIVQQERRLGFSFIETLLEGRFEETPASLERARLFGFNPDCPYQVGVILVQEPIPLTAEALEKRDVIAEQVRRNMVDSKLKPLIAVALNSVVLILPPDTDVEKVLRNLPESEGTLLLGRPSVGIAGVKTSYEEALSMRAHALRGEIHRYEDWIIPRVLMGDIEARKALYSRVFAPIHEQRNGDRLVESLIAWVEESFNISQTSQRLGVHRNTFYSRLKRLEGALNRDLDDPRFRFELQLAVETLSITHNH